MKVKKIAWAAIISPWRKGDAINACFVAVGVTSGGLLAVGGVLSAITLAIAKSKNLPSQTYRRLKP